MDLLTKQVGVFEDIKTLCANYKKDGASRKTVDYLEKRLKKLENLWETFVEQHTILLRTTENKNIGYFNDQIYEKTKTLYDSTKKNMMSLLTAQQNTEPQSIEFDLTGMIVEETGDSLRKLIVQQERNFKALAKAMSKINTDVIAEKWELEEHLAMLKAKWDCIDKLHWELEDELKGSNFQDEYTQKYESYEQKYDNLKKGLNSKIWSTVHYQQSAPKINIPEFTGNYIHWITFKDIFVETIHNNPSISKAQKMQHLKTKLRGEAERLVHHLSISADNYDSCWDILTHRYDNRRLQFTSFMNTIQQLPSIQQPNANNLKRMHDVLTECLNGLSNMGVEVSSCGSIMVYLMTQKLDSTTLNEYTKETQNNRQLPDLDEFLTFLENKFLAYETAKGCTKESSSHSQIFNKTFNKPNYKYQPNNNWNYKHNFNTNRQQHSKKPTLYEQNKDYSKTFHTTYYGRCPLCTSDHVLMKCEKFLNMDIPQRNKMVTKLKVCKNCLYSHGNADCASWKTCRECNSKHHTLLHMTRTNDSNSAMRREEGLESSPRASTSNQHVAHHLYADDTEILLTTVQVKVKTADGTFITLRGLLDQGSQINLITENAAQLLRLPRTKFDGTVSGIGATSRNCKGILNLDCQSIHSDYTFNMQALVLQNLTNKLPSVTFNGADWTHLQNLKLADPSYNVSNSIDVLLGADVYANIILDGILKGQQHSPIAQQTQLGWILCGKLKTLNCHLTLLDFTDLSKYWENEDITPGAEDIVKNDECERYYRETTKRGSDGKYIVKMPMIKNYEKAIGDSKSMAIGQFLQLEKKLAKNKQLSLMYRNFIAEYLGLQHMKPASQITSSSNQNECYLPHHGVLRDHSTTTKLRVVFNASQKTSSGKSLNSLMEKGPNLQKDIQALILKWRTYKYAFTADVEKMYRCIWINEGQQQLQKIIWRNSQREPLQEYALCTVTYGTKSAPWLAMRTLQQLATDDGHLYPDAAKVLLEEFYVDDLTGGHNCLETAKKLQTDLIQLLARGGMNLRKWSSNCPKLLEHLSEDQISKTTFDFKQEDAMKTLGLGWNPVSDTFTFNWNLKQEPKKGLTKRTLLSAISQLYDPLGWFSPVTIRAKLIFQRVWAEKIAWDEILPVDIQNEWLKIKTQLKALKTIKINRWIGGIQNNIELLAFCDASEKAYACVIYTRVLNESNQPCLTLLIAKTRVAPLAQKLSLPRLELSGALLLSQLVAKVTESLKGHNITVRAWCDSKVVLAWLQGEASRWERYVENRVLKIKEVIPASQWSYIESKGNPADCTTRGLYPEQLVNYNLWWSGPVTPENYTKGALDQFTCSHITKIEEKMVEPALQQTNNVINKLLSNCSTLTRVIRVIAWILRFKTNALKNATTIMKFDTDHPVSPNYLTTSELNHANNIIIRIVQQLELNKDYDLLRKRENVHLKSTICKLNPYLDKEGIIRVGGRLNKSTMPAGMKNPAIIPRNSRLTELIIHEAHLATLHGGARLTLSYIRQQYWIVGGNRAVKSQLRRCVRCHRFRSKENYQLMADLPSQRVTPSRPFTHTGVDFTGHVDIKLNKGRGVKTSKGYIAIFVCLATKAVHIELVSDLSTETFLNALQRMCSRRGTPSHMYSDCGTNFIGASKMLNNEYELFKIELSCDFFEELSRMKIEWHFNAPAWPTAGGLWEAAVRSMKHHLRRVLGEQKLTYEELSSLLTKVEACLNSRPLCPLTEDPDEFYNYLTPGHFLTGSPTLTLPLSSYADDRNLDLRKRWQLTENMFHQFWKHWSVDYLTSLQARSKWLKPTPNIKTDDVVLVKENNLPPGKWALGRVIEVHPGSDGHVRVATIKTQTTTLKRPITKLSLLPIETRTINTNQSEQQDGCGTTSTPEPRPRQGTRRTGKKTFFTMITTLLLLTIVVGISGNVTNASSSAQITSLGIDRPIYYDKVGKIQLIHDEWRLLMYYNLSTYWSGVQKFENYLADITSLCESLEPRYCTTTIQQLSHEMELLTYYNNVLLAPHKQLSSRKKRGLIDGVGYVANSLFGVLDQRFADQYHMDIQTMQKNENYLLQLIQNQTSIIEIENEVLKRNEENLNQQFTLINKFMNETDINLAKIESGIEIAMATSFFSSASLAAHLLLNNLKNIQETLFNTFVDIYKGKMDVHLVTPVNLIKQLNIISGKLPKTLTLPVDNIQDEIKDIYKLIHVKARVTCSYFMYELHIPLASDEDFEVYQIFPLPLKNLQKPDEIAAVAVSSEYIAVNIVKNTYVTLNDKELNRCVQRSVDNFVCILNLPIYNLLNTNAPCEAKLLGHQTTSPCNTKRTECVATWIELHNINTWLAVTCDTYTIRTICNGDVRSHVISESSIVTLKQGCLLQTEDLIIHSHNNYNSNARLNYNIQIPSLDETINGIVKPHFTPMLKISHEEGISIVQDQLRYLRRREQLPAPLSTHDIHHYTITYLLLVVVVVSIAIWIVKKRGYCTNKKSTTPRRKVIDKSNDVESQSCGPSTKVGKFFRSRSLMERPRSKTASKSVPSKDIEFRF